MKHNLFIITSCINPVASAIDVERRFQQTLLTIGSIRRRAPDSIILLSESSPNKISYEKFQVLNEKVDFFLMLSDIDSIKYFGSRYLKSSAEANNLYLALGYIRKLDLPLKRIFKVTGRGILNEHFEISHYEKSNLKGKYVFAKRQKSHLAKDLRILNTRCWSFCYTLLDEIEQNLIQIGKDCETKVRQGYNMEHAIYDIIDKDKLVEKKVVGFTCQISQDGAFRHD